MTDVALPLALGAATGLALGVGHFAGLWWTVRRALRARRPAVWMAASAVVRGAVVLAGFAGLARIGAWPLLAALAGFLVARAGTLRTLGRPPARPAASRADATSGPLEEAQP